MMSHSMRKKSITAIHLLCLARLKAPTEKASTNSEHFQMPNVNEGPNTSK
jgi:hypothetical protein